MATDRTYNHSEIQRYLRKEMSPAEMHAFEKAMMNDPFLADAFEGLQETDAELATQHLSEIKEEITPKKDEAKVIGFSSSTKWMRIAAIFLVLAGAGFVTYTVLDKGEQTELASVTQPQNIEVDTISASGEERAQTQSLPGRPANDNTLRSSPIIKDVPPTAQASPTAPLAMSESAIDSTSLAIMDTSAKSETALLDEVAINSARSPKLASKEMARKTALTQPREGWVAFQAYVDNEVTKAREKNPLYANNQVELEFAIDKDGNATDIKIIKSSSTDVSKVAVEILRKSPRWTPSANNAKARLVVNF